MYGLRFQLDSAGEFPGSGRDLVMVSLPWAAVTGQEAIAAERDPLIDHKAHYQPNDQIVVDGSGFTPDGVLFIVVIAPDETQVAFLARVKSDGSFTIKFPCGNQQGNYNVEACFITDGVNAPWVNVLVAAGPYVLSDIYPPNYGPANRVTLNAGGFQQQEVVTFTFHRTDASEPDQVYRHVVDEDGNVVCDDFFLPFDLSSHYSVAAHGVTSGRSATLSNIHGSG